MVTAFKTYIISIHWSLKLVEGLKYDSVSVMMVLEWHCASCICAVMQIRCCTKSWPDIAHIAKFVARNIVC